jgi:hypothetical protein
MFVGRIADDQRDPFLPRSSHHNAFPNTPVNSPLQSRKALRKPSRTARTEAG